MHVTCLSISYLNIGRKMIISKYVLAKFIVFIEYDPAQRTNDFNKQSYYVPMDTHVWDLDRKSR